MLQDDVRIDEVERVGLEPLEIGRIVDEELALRKRLVEPPRLRDHRLRDVHADRCLVPRPQRASEPADAAPEVEGAATRDGPQAVRDRQHLRDLSLTRCEEAIRVPGAALVLRRRQHGPHRIRLGEALPILLVAFQAHPPDSRRSGCRIGPEREG